MMLGGGPIGLFSSRVWGSLKAELMKVGGNSLRIILPKAVGVPQG